MKIFVLILASILFMTAPTIPSSHLEAYGYQPDSQGYAYAESTYVVNAAPLIPIAALAAAIIVGIILYSGHHHRSCKN